MTKPIPLEPLAVDRTSDLPGNQSVDIAPAANQITLYSAISRIGERDPDRPAVRWNGDVYTYAALLRRAQTIAHALAGEIARGTEGDLAGGRPVFPGVVGLCLERSFDLVAGLVACQILGCSYVPMDTEYPLQRLTHMLRTSRPDVLVTSRRTAAACGLDTAPGRVLYAEDIGEGESEGRTSNSALKRARGGHDATPVGGYQIYTSGSTGLPKAVNMKGRALANLIAWQLELSGGLPENAATGQFAPISFDVSFQEIFSTLCAGGLLVLFSPEQRRDPFLLIEEIERSDISRLFLPFVALKQLVQSAAAAGTFPSSLREIHTAGEQLVVSEPVRAFFRALPKCRLFNQYGPSETHVVACYALGEDPDSWQRLPPVGKAIHNVGLHVLKGDNTPVEPGEIGELCISGRALAAGYVRNDKATEEKFRFVCLDGQFLRIYRSGDLARVDEQGQVEFHGRADQQVKIDGYRVELGEIESVLSDHAAVEKAVVVHDRDEGAGGALAAFIIVKTGRKKPALSGDIASFLAAQLPGYMIPSAIRFVDEFPRTASGKIDRKALAQKGREGKPITSTPLKTTNQPGERIDLCDFLVQTWRDITGREDLDREDNVFDHGARSVMVPEFQRRLLEQRGRRVSAASVFEYPSCAKLALYLSGGQPSTFLGQGGSNVGLARKAASLLRRSR
ncbi:amino acid adenylation domain-containing protein [Breoghania corrubedonensis]|uniref:Amino acid adenylation domain-containing protein n=1 Tax=Breoghania corrubedonensis TaxID=665038 RepID=A0A2T5V8X1_9HYPH|nr:amino acid adenylation domain-containing protein [Breoghania corrubedonensis]PTW60202.1 amino acid adenylation domain-containing protein [Breoghania corrubedonensis]